MAFTSVRAHRRDSRPRYCAFRPDVVISGQYFRREDGTVKNFYIPTEEREAPVDPDIIDKYSYFPGSFFPVEGVLPGTGDYSVFKIGKVYGSSPYDQPIGKYF